MKTKTLMLSIAGVLLVQVPLAAQAGERIELVERAVTDATLDLGAKGDSAGDLLTWSNPLFDAANKAQVGSDQGFCVRTTLGKSWECTWTNQLKGGEITVNGIFYDEQDSMLSIVGGTGKYAGARGTMKVHSRDAKSTSYQLIFQLL